MTYFRMLDFLECILLMTQKITLLSTNITPSALIYFHYNILIKIETLVSELKDTAYVGKV